MGEWDPDAERWVSWARTPGFDAYWYFRDAFYDDILPAAGLRTLEIGCGEGRVARDLVGRGHAVVALDTATTLVHYAEAEDDQSAYAVATGSALPFPDTTFDIVVAYNSLQVVDDMAATVRESARVLTAGGVLCACIAHPATDLGEFTTIDGDRRFAMRADYRDRRRVEDILELEGQSMTFRGWTYSFEHYARALESAGFVIEALREPRPVPDAEKYRRWEAFPLFLNFRARRV